MSSQLKKVSVLNSQVVEDYTVYQLKVTFVDASWYVSRRYSEFYSLNEVLTKQHGIDKNLLPARRLFGNQRHSVIEERKAGLSNYLDQICKLLNPLPSCIKLFLDFHRHHPLSITYDLARHLFHHGDEILMSRLPVRLSSLQLFSITQRLLTDAAPTENGDKESDIGHLFDVLYCLESLEVTGTGRKFPDNRSLLTQDLEPFKSMTQLLVDHCDLGSVVCADRLKDQLQTLSVHQTISSCQELLVNWPSEEVRTSPWCCLVTLNLNNNQIKEIDDSVKLLLHVEQLDLSSNRIQVIANLKHLPRLRWLNLAHNEISSVDALHLHLGNVTTLLIQDNCISSLAGLHRVFSLEHVNASYNQLHQFGDVSALKHLPSLEEVELKGNPLCSVANYRLTLLSSLPQQVVLDKQACSARELSKLSQSSGRHPAPLPASTTGTEQSSSTAASSTAARMQKSATPRTADGRQRTSDDSGGDADDIVVTRSRTSLPHKASRRVRFSGPSSAAAASGSKSSSAIDAATSTSADLSTPDSQGANDDTTDNSVTTGADSLRKKLDLMRQEGGASWLEMLNELYPQQSRTSHPTSSPAASLVKTQRQRKGQRKEEQRSKAKAVASRRTTVPLTPAILQIVSRSRSRVFQQQLRQAAEDARKSGGGGNGTGKTSNFLVTNDGNEQIICSVDVQKMIILEINLATGQAANQQSLSSLQSVQYSEDPYEITLTFSVQAEQLKTEHESTAVAGAGAGIDTGADAGTDVPSTNVSKTATTAVHYKMSSVAHLAKLLAMLLPWSLANDQTLSENKSMAVSSKVSLFPVLPFLQETIYLTGRVQDDKTPSPSTSSGHGISVGSSGIGSDISPPVHQLLPTADHPALSKFFYSLIAGFLGSQFEELVYVGWSSCQRYGSDVRYPCCLIISNSALHLLRLVDFEMDGGRNADQPGDSNVTSVDADSSATSLNVNVSSSSSSDSGHAIRSVSLSWLASCLLSDINQVSIGLFGCMLRIQSSSSALASSAAAGAQSSVSASTNYCVGLPAGPFTYAVFTLDAACTRDIVKHLTGTSMPAIGSTIAAAAAAGSAGAAVAATSAMASAPTPIITSAASTNVATVSSSAVSDDGHDSSLHSSRNSSSMSATAAPTTVGDGTGAANSARVTGDSNGAGAGAGDDVVLDKQAAAMDELMMALRNACDGHDIGQLLVYKPVFWHSAEPAKPTTTSAPMSAAAAAAATPTKAAGGLPVSLAITSSFIFLVDEDCVHWPSLSGASNLPPSTPRYTVCLAYHLRSLALVEICNSRNHIGLIVPGKPLPPADVHMQFDGAAFLSSSRASTDADVSNRSGQQHADASVAGSYSNYRHGEDDQAAPASSLSVLARSLQDVREIADALRTLWQDQFQSQLAIVEYSTPSALTCNHSNSSYPTTHFSGISSSGCTTATSGMHNEDVNVDTSDDGTSNVTRSVAAAAASVHSSRAWLGVPGFGNRPSVSGSDVYQLLSYFAQQLSNTDHEQLHFFCSCDCLCWSDTSTTHPAAAAAAAGHHDTATAANCSAGSNCGVDERSMTMPSSPLLRQAAHQSTGAFLLLSTSHIYLVTQQQQQQQQRHHQCADSQHGVHSQRTTATTAAGSEAGQLEQPGSVILNDSSVHCTEVEVDNTMCSSSNHSGGVPNFHVLLSLPLCDLRHVTVSIFDQCVRFEGELGGMQTALCYLLDGSDANILLENIIELLQANGGAQVGDAPSTMTNRSSSGGGGGGGGDGGGSGIVYGEDHHSDVGSSNFPVSAHGMIDGTAEELVINGTVHCHWPQPAHLATLNHTLHTAATTAAAAAAAAISQSDNLAQRAGTEMSPQPLTLPGQEQQQQQMAEHVNPDASTSDMTVSPGPAQDAFSLQEQQQQQQLQEDFAESCSSSGGGGGANLPLTSTLSPSSLLHYQTVSVAVPTMPPASGIDRHGIRTFSHRSSSRECAESILLPCCVALNDSALHLVFEDNLRWPAPAFVKEQNAKEAEKRQQQQLNARSTSPGARQGSSDNTHIGTNTSSSVSESCQYTVLATRLLHQLRSISIPSYGSGQVCLNFSPPTQGVGSSGDNSSSGTSSTSSDQKAMGVAEQATIATASCNLSDSCEWLMTFKTYEQAEKLVRILQLLWSMSSDSPLAVSKISPI